VRDGDDLPLDGRLVAFDLGSVRVGVAVSDATQVVASPDATLAVAPSDDAATIAGVLAAAATERDAVGVVIGDPRALDGSRGEASRRARAVADALRTSTGMPVRLVDERFTTTEAERVLIAADVSRSDRRGVVDRVAASVILQTVLAAHQRRRSAP
jgi:putative Holliday junction resolvase